MAAVAETVTATGTSLTAHFVLGATALVLAKTGKRARATITGMVAVVGAGGVESSRATVQATGQASEDY